MAFSEHIKNFAHSHAVQGARAYFGGHVDDWRNLHSNRPGAKEYLTGDAGRATARAAAGTAVDHFLRRSSAAAYRKGGYIKGALFSFAQMAFQSHMNVLKHDQRIFENVAKVRRGDPEIQHMTHQQLREVAAQARKYGGADTEHVLKTAQGEIDRRMKQKNTEHAVGLEHRDNLVNANKQALKQQNHVERMRRLKEATGHTAAARISLETKVNQIKRQREEIKTKGTQKRQGAIQETIKAKTAWHILKYGKSGGGTDQNGNYHTKEEIQKHNTSGGGSVPKHAPAAAPMRRTRRKRAI